VCDDAVALTDPLRLTGRKPMALARFVLGCLQMLGAVVSLFLLLQTGVSTLTLSVVVITCVCTTVSVLLFGSHRQGRKQERR
jgi:hypothetical protein